MRSVAAAAVLAACAAPAFAAETPGEPMGPEFWVSPPATGFQGGAVVAGGPEGNAVVVWERFRPDESSEILARRYDVSGAVLGEVLRVSAGISSLELEPAVAMSADGGFVVAWSVLDQQGNDGYDVYARRYDAAGVPQGAPFRVNTTVVNDQFAPDVAMDAAGNFVVAWTSFDEDGSGHDIYARRYDAAGAALGGEFRVNETTPDAQQFPSIAMSPTGAFVVAWQSLDQDGSGYGIYAQRYNAAGAAQGAELQVNTATDGDQQSPSAAMDAAGNFVIAWRLDFSGDDVGVHARLYDAAGAPRGGQFPVDDSDFFGDSQSLAVAMDTRGRFVITWAADSCGDGCVDTIAAQLYDADGVAQGERLRVNSLSTSVDVCCSGVAMDADGDFAVVWVQFDFSESNDFSGVWGRRFAGPEDIDLSVAIIDSPAPILPGGVYSYNLIVSNDHAVTAPTGVDAIDRAIGTGTGIRAVATLPEGATFLDYNGTDWTCTQGARTSPDIVCDYAGILRPMTSINTDLLLEVQAPAARDVIASVTVRGNQYDGNPGNDTDSVASTVRPLNTVPAAFQFVDRAGVAPGAVVVSNAITVSGIEAPAPILIFGVEGAQYSIDGGAYTAEPGSVGNGSTVAVRLTAWPEFSTTSNATLVIGGVRDTFSVTTAAEGGDVQGNSATGANVLGSSVPGGGGGSLDWPWLAAFAAGLLWSRRRPG